MSGTKEDAEFVIDIIDDTPEEDKGRPVAPETTENDDDIDEVAQHSKGVQKRIKDLTAKAHAERRAKEAMARERDEAINYGRAIKAEADRLREMAEKAEALAIDQTKERAKSQLSWAEREARDAFESGDSEKIAKANTLLARLAAEETEVSRWTPRKIPESQKPPEATHEPEPKAKQWAEKNEWFGVNKRMTAYAYGVHEELVAEGVDPRSDTYYNRLDAAMRETFPKQLGAEERDEEEPVARSPKSPVVAPATRSVKAPRRVQLTASQVSLANRLGLTPEQYAAQLIKEMKDG